MKNNDFIPFLLIISTLIVQKVYYHARSELLNAKVMTTRANTHSAGLVTRHSERLRCSVGTPECKGRDHKGVHSLCGMCDAPRRKTCELILVPRMRFRVWIVGQPVCVDRLVLGWGHFSDVNPTSPLLLVQSCRHVWRHKLGCADAGVWSAGLRSRRAFYHIQACMCVQRVSDHCELEEIDSSDRTKRNRKVRRKMSRLCRYACREFGVP